MSTRVQPSGRVSAKPLSATTMRPVVARLLAGVAAAAADGDAFGDVDAGAGVTSTAGATDADGVELPQAASAMDKSVIESAPPRRRVWLVMSVVFPLRQWSPSLGPAELAVQRPDDHHHHGRPMRRHGP